MPLISNQHFLLVTLLLCNACAMEALPLFLDRLADPITAIVISVTAVLLFGEIIPQAVCSRWVGAWAAGGMAPGSGATTTSSSDSTCSRSSASNSSNNNNNSSCSRSSDSKSISKYSCITTLLLEPAEDQYPFFFLSAAAAVKSSLESATGT
jgi:hypothetical protein